MIKTGLRASPTNHISRYETNAISSNRVMNRFLPAINKLYYRLASLKGKPAQKPNLSDQEVLRVASAGALKTIVNRIAMTSCRRLVYASA